MALRRENMLWFRVPPKIYFKGGALDLALRELKGKKRAFIVTDKPLFDLGTCNAITKSLDHVGVEHTIFYDVEPDPTLLTVRKGLAQLTLFKPDVIIAVGGGSPMDAAKVMWLMYEQPDTKFEGLSQRFMDIRKRVYDVPTLGAKAMMIAIPTTSGTGSEVTPFSVITDESTGMKYPLADYALTPSMAIIDPFLVTRMPKRLTAYGGIDAVTHALESYVSVCATEFTQGHSREALRLLFKYLPRAYNNLENDLEAREKVHYAATIAGMAFANAFLGICHSLAHKLGAAFHVPHGLANAAMISHVIAYNATDSPFKMATFSQYHAPSALHAYAELSEFLGFGQKTDTDERKVIKLIEAIEGASLAARCVHGVGSLPSAFRPEEAAGHSVDHQGDCGRRQGGGVHGEAGRAGGECVRARTTDIAPCVRVLTCARCQFCLRSFDDQCTGANPRYPLIKELRGIYESAWSKPILPLARLDAYVADHHESAVAR